VTAPATPKDYGPIQLANRLGLAEWQFEAARRRGLVPEPDLGRRWSAGLAEQLAGRVAQIVAAVGTELPIGANKAAARLAERTGLEVDRADVEELAERGLLEVAGTYKEWPVYDTRQLDGLDRDELAAVVSGRQAWLAASLVRPAAAERLGWRWEEFDRVVQEHGVEAGRFGRYAVSDIDVLAADEELAERILADRLLGPDQAAARLEVRRTDFEYCLAAGWIEPETHISVRVGRRRRIAVSLYRTADVDRLLELPGVDWEAVRACHPGALSPLRQHARLPATRARVVHAFCRELAARWDVDVWAFYDGAGDQWEIDWARDRDGQPDRDEVERAIAAHPGAARHRRSLMLGTGVGRAIRWARAMLEPGAAVILDTETTDLPGPVCEIAVVDTTGEVLLDTLVDPGQPISPEATWVHGIADADVAGAPSWAEVLPRLAEVTRGRRVLAYNADFDRGVVLADTCRHGLEPEHLADAGRWSCLMHARSMRERAWGRLALYGPHRALGDCRAALAVLREIAASPRGGGGH
jgi:Exonuclease